MLVLKFIMCMVGILFIFGVIGTVIETIKEEKERYEKMQLYSKHKHLGEE